MNLQQLEYIIAVDNFRGFRKAAESCHVTQATLSAMIHRLEEELEITIFDRSKKPVVPTAPGKEIIKKAREVLHGVTALQEVVHEVKTELKGELRLGIIPTLAPYLLPLFIKSFITKYPGIQLKIKELTTDQIADQLQNDFLDIGLLATPLNNKALKEEPLFYEQFYLYVSDRENTNGKQFVLPSDIDINRLWLLEEGHCLRNQIYNLCELRKTTSSLSNLEYSVGSMESLLQMVDLNEGITVVPELTAQSFSEARKSKLLRFKAPEPVREISMVVYRPFVKLRLYEVLKSEILEKVGKVISLENKQDAFVVDI